MQNINIFKMLTDKLVMNINTIIQGSCVRLNWLKNKIGKYNNYVYKFAESLKCKRK